MRHFAVCAGPHAATVAKVRSTVYLCVCLLTPSIFPFGHSLIHEQVAILRVNAQCDPCTSKCHSSYILRVPIGESVL
jgi:hypothetical protein